MDMRVAIVGAGWAGMACAIAAASAGARVHVYDMLPTIAPQQQAVAIAPNLMRALDVLGVAERCVRLGFPYPGFTLTDVDARTHAELPFVRLCGPRLPPAMGIGADLLTDVLHQAARDEGALLHWDTPVQGVEFDGGRWLLRLSGSAAVRPDLAVLAGGADMALDGLPFAARSQADEVTWWGGLTRRPLGLDQPLLVLAGQGRKAWFVPVDGHAAGLWLIDPSLQTGSNAPSTLLVRRWLQAQGGSLARMADALGEDLSLRPVRVRAGLRPGPWHHANLLCVGDAAHVLPHHLSQSPAQAIEDAVVLGALLAQSTDPAASAQAFSLRRQARVRAIFEVASRTAQWDRAPDGVAGIDQLTAALAEVIAPAA